MAIDAKEILNKVARVGDNVSMNISMDAYTADFFKLLCKELNVKYSQVTVELVKQFIETAPKDAVAAVIKKLEAKEKAKSKKKPS